MLTKSAIENYLVAFTKSIGSENFITAAQDLAEAETATFPTSQKVLGIATPNDLKQLHACILLANEHQTPLYPISRGKNWGYGSRVPYQNKSIIVSLEKMNRIIAYDERMGTVTLEPGVSFGQLRQFLQSKKSDWLIDAPGSTLEASVIGNTLERGFAQSQHSQRHEQVINLEVMLPNGDIVNTGMGTFENANTKALHAAGLGPDLKDVFLQSNLGIVTKMTLQLNRRPKYRMQLFFHFRKMHFADLTNCLRELHQREILTVSASLYNKKRLLSTAGESMKLDTKYTDNQWFGTSSIHGDNIQLLRGKQYAIEEAFAKPDLNFHWGAMNHKNPHYGWSSPNNLKLAYAKSQQPSGTPNPNLDGCGLIWIAPIVPMEGEAMKQCVHIVTKVLKEYNFEAFISIHKINSRVAYLIAPIIYDRKIKGLDEKAMVCHEHLLQQLTAEGFYPYRLSQASIDQLPRPEENYTTLLKAIKRQLDPNNILAPGRFP